ncbi:hypothetical protein EVAR_79279_1 [Eumeta japonica]|uniref:Uncharacterized protein n=1 Tax=Eumeta variegata TaxID=151549 RepID=A0A4C1TEP1_EUMVA|nr:hypothetical protein EVAR_79279_1 [Eumeta japonica]
MRAAGRFYLRRSVDKDGKVRIARRGLQSAGNAVSDKPNFTVKALFDVPKFHVKISSRETHPHDSRAPFSYTGGFRRHYTASPVTARDTPKCGYIFVGNFSSLTIQKHSIDFSEILEQRILRSRLLRNSKPKIVQWSCLKVLNALRPMQDL